MMVMCRCYETGLLSSASTARSPAGMPERHEVTGDLIDAACQALVDGLDSPALRELAGASVRDATPDIRELVSQVITELRLPQPGAGVVRGSGIDSLRLVIASVGDVFEVQVYVNGVEMTKAGAGLGMDP
jgi:hypothetical protein